MNTYAINLIMQFEKCRLKAYQDGGGVWTIGYGHTGKEVTSSSIITQKQADALLNQDYLWFEAGVKRAVKVDLNDRQLGALISFCFNVGLHNFLNSTLLKLINSKNAHAAQEFLKWNKDNGVVVNGLTKRREAEKQLFLQTQ